MRFIFCFFLFGLLSVAFGAPSGKDSSEEEKKQQSKEVKKTAADLKKGMFITLDGRPTKLTKVTLEEEEVLLEGEDIFKGTKAKATLKKDEEIPVLAKVIKEWKLVEVKDKKATLAALKGEEKKIGVSFVNEDLLEKVLEATEEGKELLVSVLTLGEESQIEGFKKPQKKNEEEEEKKEEKKEEKSD